MPAYSKVNIYDILRLDEFSYAEIVRNFSSINEDIECFLKQNALGFAKRKQAVTYLVFNGDMLAGYFTLAIKNLKIKANLISKSVEKKLQRVCTLNADIISYSPPAVLIAQLGKNFSLPNQDRIFGRDLLDIALDEVSSIQYHVGGIITFLECEKEQKLLDFYHANGFTDISFRNTEQDKRLVQLYKLI